MILGDSPQMSNAAARATLDDLFRRAGVRHPDAVALIDPPDREAITGDAPRRLTYVQADRMVSAIAARLRSFGLATDSVIGFQLPNTVESILTLLGIVRAGMIAAPLPLLWREAECAVALARLGAKALITCGRVGATHYGELGRQIAADTFAVRYVGAFGHDVPDGVVPFDDLYERASSDWLPPVERDNPAAHVAVITWDTSWDTSRDAYREIPWDPSWDTSPDVTTNGLVPVARNHAELLAGGIAGVLESQFAHDGVILSAMPVHSFAGIALTLSQWLFAGGTLALHHAFDPAVLSAQCRSLSCGLAILPGPVVAPLAQTGFFDPSEGMKAVLAVWREPERLAASARWHNPQISLTDVLVFGEIGLVAARRGPDGAPAPIPFGVVTAPRSMADGIPVAEILRTEAGTVALRGAMVPRHPYPPHAARGSAPYLRIAPSGFIDTGYGCGVDPATLAMAVTGAPPGIVSVGGYRFRLRDLQDLIANLDPRATLAALPDAFAGHRLAGSAVDNPALRKALAARGVNPLLIRAFRDRPSAA